MAQGWALLLAVSRLRDVVASQFKLRQMPNNSRELPCATAGVSLFQTIEARTKHRKWTEKFDAEQEDPGEQS
jgi:hypothetical protein